MAGHAYQYCIFHNCHTVLLATEIRRSNYVPLNQYYLKHEMQRTSKHLYPFTGFDEFTGTS
ncbi:hypothetical protein T4C_2507 [Trichinella pseudospiralis]|uniref:Uncharacterized protein n=1 Tax=Trichinella pseudospiralis TaxID=6337 RepID=A0A0V1K5K7_TRIPS|nr:hypothetical protein T4C_2507 [Trichinella pseudospiralis]